MDLESKKIYKKKKNHSMLISILFLIIIMVATGGLYFYNNSIITANELLDSKIKKNKVSIAILEAKPHIIASILYLDNKRAIEKRESYSEVTTYIEHLKYISKIYGVEFKGFNYSGPKISTTLISSNSSIWKKNYEKIAHLISDYRKNKNNKFLFDLEFIKWVSTKNDWKDNVANIEFVLKKDISNILKLSNKKTNSLKK